MVGTFGRRLYEPAGDAVGVVAADFAGVGVEHIDADLDFDLVFVEAMSVAERGSLWGRGHGHDAAFIRALSDGRRGRVLLGGRRS